ncbi:MAG: hypothetical protein EXR78_10245 [Deltaproteobacteria bacterium]|nr:hypothetical protein [Deltaproteobacteria bacterium]
MPDGPRRRAEAPWLAATVETVGHPAAVPAKRMTHLEQLDVRASLLAGLGLPPAQQRRQGGLPSLWRMLWDAPSTPGDGISTSALGPEPPGAWCRFCGRRGLAA